MFSAIAFNSNMERVPLVALVFLLASTIVVAQNGTELVLPPSSHYDLDPIDIEDGSGWRDDSSSEYDWRAPEDRQAGRIRYGYDPSYEEQQLRDNQRYNLDNNPSASGLETTPAPTQFRFNF